MKFLVAFGKFLNPQREAKKLLDIVRIQTKEIRKNRKKIKDLLHDYQLEELWRNQYTGAFGLLTDTMQSMVWQKDTKHRYILANPTHCRSYFGFEGSKQCLKEIFNHTDDELIKKMFHDRGIQNTVIDISRLSDEYTINNKSIVHFFEKGLIDGIPVLVYVVKIPQYEDNKLIGTMGIGWDFSEKIVGTEKMIQSWKENDQVKTIFENSNTFCYVVDPEIHRCEIFQHICPLPCKFLEDQEKVANNACSTCVQKKEE